jgi:uncharacterized membrane-anchored protein
MHRLYALALTIAVALASPAARAADSPQQIFDRLQQQKGEVQLGSNLAHLSLTQHFAYLNPTDAETFLVQIWKNPPGSGKDSLGLIIPTGPEGPEYAILVNYEDSGNVSDSDAATIDYDKLLKDMQESTREDSEERQKQGYATYELLGWAKPPYYDAQAKKLHWAKRLKFSDSTDETLNYEIRVLGRGGVLDLNVIGGMDQLAMIDGHIDEILAMVGFNPGNTYAEFKPGVDKAAEYGIAGLIAGGILAKAGFFKFLLGFAKPLIVGGIAMVAAIGGFFKRLFRRA